MAKAKYIEMTLADYLKTCGSQEAAAKALGCSQGNIPQALKAIAEGKKSVTVRVYPDGSAEADIIKPFGRRKTAA